MDKILYTFQTLLQYTGKTVTLTLAGIAIGIVLGLLLAVGRISKNKILQTISWFYIWVFRGTPLLMQIFFIYYALPLIHPALQFPGMFAGVIALGLNSGAYLSEIFRPSILSIDKN